MAPIIEVSNIDLNSFNQLGFKYKLRNDLEKSTNDFIYVPSINLYVAKERTLFNQNFYEVQKELRSKNEKVLTISEFREFLKFTKTNFQEIYKEITEVKNPCRAEWLDADFKYENNILFVEYHVFENGKIVKKSKKLDKDTLMKDKNPGISLDSWLEDSTKQGLPKNNSKEGSLYYWAPDKDNNSVAGFNADDDWADLSANGDPSLRFSNLGVRACKLGDKK